MMIAIRPVAVERPRVAELVHRVRAEYLENPGLSLTRAQAQRFWSMDPDTCTAVLEELEASRFLVRTPRDMYALSTAL
jgi:hypothetical protein